MLIYQIPILGLEVSLKLKEIGLEGRKRRGRRKTGKGRERGGREEILPFALAVKIFSLIDPHWLPLLATKEFR